VTRLRVFLDRKYPVIVEECVASMEAVVPDTRVHVLLTPSNCYSVSAYARSWPCLFPQNGPAPKHTRPIFLAKWQQRLAERWTASFPKKESAAVPIYVSCKADVATLDEFVGPKR
jgi:hypothetical protein